MFKFQTSNSYNVFNLYSVHPFNYTPINFAFKRSKLAIKLTLLFNLHISDCTHML